MATPTAVHPILLQAEVPRSSIPHIASGKPIPSLLGRASHPSLGFLAALGGERDQVAALDQLPYESRPRVPKLAIKQRDCPLAQLGGDLRHGRESKSSGVAVEPVVDIEAKAVLRKPTRNSSRYLHTQRMSLVVG